MIGSVWSGIGAARAPVSGVTVEADPAHSEVLYVDLVADQLVVLPAGATATNDKGLFVLFTDTMLDVTLKSALGEKTIHVGSFREADATFPAVALVQL